VKKLSVILDNNSTHKMKMQAQLQAHLSDLNIQDKIRVEFLYTPPYSPDFNLAEYLIHLLRLQLLHHLPISVNIQQIREKLETYFQNHQLQTAEQIQNTIRHICALVK
jgi:transposase